MSSEQFKEPYNIYYFLGFILALLIPTAPATLTLLKHAGILSVGW
ncbi:hypothetical protein [Paraferrimonas sp. SM1919]|nr:hypothetical protein [Paraferrimonas sp. SM1919]